VEAVAWARERGAALFVLGGGSNLLVSDAGFDGLVLAGGVQ
jgi:UDP-N-acetylmuramate dehydrogenase